MLSSSSTFNENDLNIWYLCLKYLLHSSYDDLKEPVSVVHYQACGAVIGALPWGFHFW